MEYNSFFLQYAGMDVQSNEVKFKNQFKSQFIFILKMNYSLFNETLKKQNRKNIYRIV